MTTKMKPYVVLLPTCNENATWPKKASGGWTNSDQRKGGRLREFGSDKGREPKIKLTSFVNGPLMNKPLPNLVLSHRCA